jgi:hypothetical protein
MLTRQAEGLRKQGVGGILGTKREKGGENYITRSFMVSS